MNTPTPDPERLVSLASGELPPAQASALEGDVARNAEALRQLASLRRVIAAMRLDGSVDPPDHAMERARRIFRRFQPAAESRGWLTAAIEAVAALIDDSRTQPALAGLRGQDDGYQLTFSADECEVELRIEPATLRHRGPQGAGCQLLGQVTAAASPPDAIAFAPAGCREPLREVSLDERGAFDVMLAPGRYDVLVPGMSGLIVIEGLDVP